MIVDLFHYIHLVQGIFPNRIVVAVKQLFLKTQDAVDSFINEVILITKLQHRNLVNSKEFCVNEKEKFFTFEYVYNADLIPCHDLQVGTTSFNAQESVGFQGIMVIVVHTIIQFERTNLVLSTQCNIEHFDMLV